VTDSVDLMIAGATLVTMDAEERVIEDGCVAIANGEIVHVGSRADLGALEAAETIDAAGQLLMPGLVNGHVHMGDSLFRSLVEDLPLEPWLERLWISEREFVTHENVYLGVELALAEMIRSGTTCGLDMFWFPEAAAEASIEAGFRVITGPIFFDFEGPDGIANEDRLAVGEAWFDHGLPRRAEGGTRARPATRRAVPHPLLRDVDRSRHDARAVQPDPRRASGRTRHPRWSDGPRALRTPDRRRLRAPATLGDWRASQPPIEPQARVGDRSGGADAG